jgi:hypothetical protein
MDKDEKNYPDPNEIATTNIVSSSECTGVVTGLPEDEQHMNAYQEICDIPKQGSLGELKERLNEKMKQQKERNGRGS